MARSWKPISRNISTIKSRKYRGCITKHPPSSPNPENLKKVDYLIPNTFKLPDQDIVTFEAKFEAAFDNTNHNMGTVVRSLVWDAVQETMGTKEMGGCEFDHEAETKHGTQRPKGTSQETQETQQKTQNEA